MSDQSSQATEIATLGGGCFWCVEAVYEQLKDVAGVVSGYAGGTMANPTYEQVCAGTTGHAEVVQITFDPSVISYREILGVFFDIHDPTTPDRQGYDVGTQYRSVIFYHSPQQQRVAREMIAELNRARVWKDPIVTEVRPFVEFFPAEDFHQKYFKNNPRQTYCQVVVSPKVSKVRRHFAPMLKVPLSGRNRA